MNRRKNLSSKSSLKEIVVSIMSSASGIWVIHPCNASLSLSVSNEDEWRVLKQLKDVLMSF